MELLSDSFKLKDEKKKFSSWKSRIEGVASGGVTSSTYKKKDENIYGSTSSDSYGGEISLYHDKHRDKKDKEKEKEKEKKKDKKEESSDSSSSDEDDKKKKKKKKKKKEIYMKKKMKKLKNGIIEKNKEMK